MTSVVLESPKEIMRPSVMGFQILPGILSPLYRSCNSEATYRIRNSGLLDIVRVVWFPWVSFNNDIDKKIEIISVAQKITQENLEDDNITLSKKINKEAKKHGHKRKHYDRFQFWTFSSIKDILRQNYEPTYQNTQIPIIYIIGSEDIFVDPKANTELLKSFSNPMIEIEIMEGLNHYLTKKVVELQTLQMDVAFYDIDKKALDRIIEFIKEK